MKRGTRERQNLLITGPTGVGKSYLACAFAERACRSGFSALYIRAPRLYQELAVARGDGSYGRLLARLTRTQLLIIDDWGLAPLKDQERRDLLEVITATSAPPPSSPARCRSSPGTKSSATRRWPTPSATG